MSKDKDKDRWLLEARLNATPKDPAGIRWLSIPVMDFKDADAASQADVLLQVRNLRDTRAKIRDLLDVALAAGRNARDKPLDPSSRASLEKAEAIVREARAGNLLEALSLKVVEACLTLTSFGAMALSNEIINRRRAARAAAGRMSITPRQVEAFKAICARENWPLDKFKTRDKFNTLKKEKAAKEMGVGRHQVDHYLEEIFPEKKRKKGRRAASK